MDVSEDEQSARSFLCPQRHVCPLPPFTGIIVWCPHNCLSLDWAAQRAGPIVLTPRSIWQRSENRCLLSTNSKKGLNEWMTWGPLQQMNEWLSQRWNRQKTGSPPASSPSSPAQPGQPESQGRPSGTSRVSFSRVHLAYTEVKEPPQQTTNLAQPLRKVNLTQKTSESLIQGLRRDKKGKAWSS